MHSAFIFALNASLLYLQRYPTNTLINIMEQSIGHPPAKNLLHSGFHHPLLRDWQSGITVSAKNLMYPIFLCETPGAIEDIPSMPEQKRVGTNQLVPFLKPLVDMGLASIILFGVISSEQKDDCGTMADHEQGIVCKAIKLCKSAFPDLLVACDVCLCPYTSHGHCGILDKDGRIDNLASIRRLAAVSHAYALAGADIVAPSDMMDGRVGAIKELLVQSKLYTTTSVMSYSAKFASSFYGPFRDAAKSAPSFGDRKCYQLPPGARGLAKRAVIRDVEEGADIIMVKPGYPYLDVVREASDLAPNHPIAVYQVSGEYSMLYHAGFTHNLLDIRQGVIESIEAYMRAGATIIITYWTPQMLKWLADPQQ
eukprot:Partr_v1_DN26493_c1_g2_i1_m24132 putative delta-aminolevulinic acid dehydratase